MVNVKQACGHSVLGADVSLEKFDVGIAVAGSCDDLRSIKVRTFPRDRAGVQACLAWLDQQPPIDSVVMEATGYYSRELADWFHQERPQLQVFIVNPLNVKRYGEALGVRTKTDAEDARVIACYGVGRRFWLPHDKAAAHRELNRLHKDRSALVRMLKCERMRALGADRDPVAIEVHEGLCRELTKGIKALDQSIKDLVASQTPLQADVALLSSIPGVALRTATLVLGALGDLRRFDRSRQLAAFAGVSPRQRESGKTVHGRTVLCKKGCSRVRAVLFLSAMVAVRKEGPFREVYLGLVAKGKAKKAALGAIMRRLLILMRALLVSGQAYDPAKYQAVRSKDSAPS